MSHGGESAAWDFFVSYTEVDRSWAEWVAWELEAAGYSVVVQAWDILTGDNWPARVDEAVRRSAHTVAVVSPDYLASEWGAVERLAALRADPSGHGRKLLPVRVGAARDDGLLGSVVDVTLVGVAEQIARERLLAAARAVRSGERAKPANRPPFPPAGTVPPVEASRFPGRPSGIWRMPWPRNPNFVGRASELAALRHRLAYGSGAVPVLPQALHGMGGVGKTQLVVEYAYRYGRSYDVVWWVDAEQPALIVAGLAGLAERLGVAVEGKAEDSADAAVESLRRAEQHAAWLVIVDNAAGPDVLPDMPVLRALLSAAGGAGGHVVLTSRDSRWSGVATPIDVSVLPREEAARLVRSRAAGLDEVASLAVADAVDGLPLALEQAGAWLAETGMPADVYERELRSRAQTVMSHGAPAGREPVATTWTVTLHRLDDPTAVALAQLWAHFGPEPIPVDLIRADVAELLPDELRPAAIDPFRYSATVGKLVRLALVRSVGGTVVMHRLVQAVLRDETDSERRDILRNAAHRLLAAAHPADRTVPRGWQRLAQIYPHLTATNLIVCSDDAARDLVVSTIWYLRRIGDHRSGRALAEQTCRAWSATAGEAHRHTLAARAELAATLRELMDYVGARTLEEQILTYRRELLGDDHPATLEAMTQLATTLWALGDYPAAQLLEEQLLERRTELLGDDHPNTLDAAAELATTLREAGDYIAARRYEERILARRLELLGEDHPDTLKAAANLATTLLEIGDYTGALALERWVLDRRRELLGEDHPDTLKATTEIAGTVRTEGDYRTALQLAERVLERCEQLLGENHPDTLEAVVNLAEITREIGNYAAATRLGQRVLDRRRELLGPDHPRTLAAMVNLAVTLRDAADYAGARELEQHVFDRRRELLGPDHPDTLDAMAAMAVISRWAADYAGARELEQHVLDRERELFGPDHTRTLAAMASLAVTVWNAGDYAGARELEQEVLDRRRELLGPDDPRTLDAMADVAVTVRNAGDYTGARELEQEVLDRRRELFGPDHTRTLDAMADLAVTLWSAADYAGARELEQEVLDRRRELFGPDHTRTL
ncbi:tetratricopeptide repeat protein, partial [Frankia sp. AgB1.9]|uniref:FxSxx-COOH system tetratricopeptide repeat protein n=1 Tax=unclassified Frankia TaxID=2632575 RepID=UPI00193498F1